jgi:hypothetical protein
MECSGAGRTTSSVGPKGFGLLEAFCSSRRNIRRDVRVSCSQPDASAKDATRAMRCNPSERNIATGGGSPEKPKQA